MSHPDPTKDYKGETMYIDEDTGVNFQDCGQWRNWQLHTQGNNLEELLAEAAISEIDQDGGEIDTYDLEDAVPEVYSAALAIIERTIKESKDAVS